MPSSNVIHRGVLLGFACAAAFVSAAFADAASGYRVIGDFHGRDGLYPSLGAPAVDSAGNVYLTTVGGGRYDRGTVVKVTLGNGPKVLHSFRTDDGDHP